MSQETKPSFAKPAWMSKAIAAVAVLLVGAGVVMARDTELDDSDDSAVVPTTPEVKTNGASAEIATAMIKDGIYSTTGNYVSPAGPETIDVTLTVKDGVVTDSTVVANAENPVSVKKQGEFIAGYKQFVVGKKLADLSLSKVSGASLTTQGFNEALGELKTQASV